MFLRYWLPITPNTHESESMADIGFAYFLAFHELGYDMRILPSSPFSETGGTRFMGRWGAFSQYASKMVPVQFINIVLGDPAAYEAKHVVQAFTPRNLAICSGLHSDVNVPKALEKYQRIWAHTQRDQEILALRNLESKFVPPGAIHDIRDELEALAK